MNNYWLAIGCASLAGVVVAIFVFAIVFGDTINDRHRRQEAEHLSRNTVIPDSVRAERQMVLESGFIRMSAHVGWELLALGIAVIAAVTLYVSNNIPSWSDINPIGSDDQPAQVHHRHHQTADGIDRQLRQVEVVRTEPFADGYERDDFGSDWRSTGDGCDMRQAILRRDLDRVRLQLDGCTVETGVLHDPYTGRRIVFTSTDPMAVQIDHRYPLAAAWDYGASHWTDDQRLAFANDPRNLVAADGPANMAKSDNTLSEWLPTNTPDVCDYVRHYLKVALRYDLPISRADARTARTTC